MVTAHKVLAFVWFCFVVSLVSACSRDELNSNSQATASSNVESKEKLQDKTSSTKTLVSQNVMSPEDQLIAANENELDTEFFLFDRYPPDDAIDDGGQSRGTKHKVGMPLDLAQKYPQLVDTLATLKDFTTERDQYLAANGFVAHCNIRFWGAIVFEIHERENDFMIEVVASAGSDDCEWTDGSCYEDWSISKNNPAVMTLIQRYKYGASTRRIFFRSDASPVGNSPDSP
jgi:hypothetical protein